MAFTLSTLRRASSVISLPISSSAVLDRATLNASDAIALRLVAVDKSGATASASVSMRFRIAAI
jgi:hypothetical protein